MKRYRKILTLMIIVAGIFAAAAGVTNAFLINETEELNNVITAGNIAIQLAEPHWNPEKAKNLKPRAVITKDPIVTNNGGGSVWVFLRIDVPVKSITTVDPKTKKKGAKENTELFTFSAQPEWTLIEKTSDSNTAHYVYGYEKILKKGESSAALFTEVTLVNYLEGEIDEEEQLAMPVEAVAIQSNVETAEDGLGAIYKEYLAQELADLEGGR